MQFLLLFGCLLLLPLFWFFLFVVVFFLLLLVIQEFVLLCGFSSLDWPLANRGLGLGLGF